MVLLIKNNVASLDDVAHLSTLPTRSSPSARLAKHSVRGKRNAGVPKAKSSPHVNLLAEGGSLRAHCAAVLNADLHKLKPKELIVRKVQSAKDDLRQLFDNTSIKQRVEHTKGSSDSNLIKLASSTTASNVATSSSLDSSCSLAVSVPAPLDEKDDDVEDLIHRLTAVAQSWLDFARLFSRRCAPSDQPIDEARRGFCEALVQSFSDRSPSASSLQVPRSSGDLADPLLFHPVCSSPAPSAVIWSNQTSVTFQPIDSSAQEKPSQSPEFSDEDLQREFDNFSFHSSQDEEWTSEVESRKQNAFNRALSDMKRKLAVPIPPLSSYFSDDSLDSAAHQTLVNPQPPCSAVAPKEDDTYSSYSADQEDESFSLSVTPPDSPVCTANLVDNAVTIRTSPAKVSLSSPVDNPTLDEQDDVELRAGEAEDGIENVWEGLVTYVPRLLTRISEESLADGYEIEATAAPPLSFRRPGSQYRKLLWSRRQRTPTLGHMDKVDFTPMIPLAEVTGSSEETSFGAGTPFATTTGVENGPGSSPVVKTLRRVKKYVDLKNPVILPVVQSTLSTETTCDTISSCDSSEFLVRRLRRVQQCLDLRKAFGRADKDSEMQRTYPALARDESAKPPIPPKPAGFHLQRKRMQHSTATIEEPSSLCPRCDQSSSLPLWSCAKITRSKGKQSRPLSESTRALKKRLDSTGIDPVTMHGHSSLRRREELSPISSISESRKPKTLKIGKLEKIGSTAVQDVRNPIHALRPLPWTKSSF